MTMNETPMNLALLGQIKNDPAFYGGSKTVRDYLTDPSIAQQLSQEDIHHLQEIEEGYREARVMEDEIKRVGVSLDGGRDYLQLKKDDYVKIIPILLAW